MVLNVGITRDPPQRALVMSQALYVSDLLEKFSSYTDPSSTRSFDTPLAEDVVLSPDDQPVVGSPAYDAMTSRRQDYMSIVGGLLWLANMTFPELAFPSGQLARFLTNPGESHLVAAVRVLLYLRGARERVLTFSPDTTRGFQCYVDSSWASKFSCSGALFFYHGCLLFWFSKVQRSVTLSSAEAEYFGAMLAARELMFLRDLAVEFALVLAGPTVLYCDSKSAVEMAFDPVAFKKTKHILRAAEYLRDLVLREAVTLEHVPGATMMADIATKAPARRIFTELLALLDVFSRSGVAHLPT